MNYEFLNQMMTSIEQLVDERIAVKVKELQREMVENEMKNESREDDYLSVEQLSELTGLKRATIYAKRTHRELPAYKFGRELRFKRDEIEKWMQSKKTFCITDHSDSHGR